MNIFLANIILTALLGMIFLTGKPSRRKRGLFCAFVTINWTLISGLRSMDVGDDTFSYRTRFYHTLNTSWHDIFGNFYQVYVNDEGKDAGYSLFEKIIQIFVKDYQGYLIVVAAIFFVCLAVWVYRSSKLPCMSYFVFSAFLFGFYAVTGIRQTVATALVVFIGSELIKKKKLWKFLIVCLVAFTIHKSSIVFIPFYFIAKKDITPRYIALVFTATPLLFIFRESYVDLLSYISGYEYDAIENTGAYTFLFMYIAITLISVILFKYVKKNTKNYKLYYNALFMGLVFMPAVFVNPAIMRVVQYFSIFLMLFIPEMVFAIEKKYRKFGYFVMLLILFAASNAYNYQYTFFWQ